MRTTAPTILCGAPPAFARAQSLPTSPPSRGTSRASGWWGFRFRRASLWSLRLAAEPCASAILSVCGRRAGGERAAAAGTGGPRQLRRLSRGSAAGREDGTAGDRSRRGSSRYAPRSGRSVGRRAGIAPEESWAAGGDSAGRHGGERGRRGGVGSGYGPAGGARQGRPPLPGEVPCLRGKRGPGRFGLWPARGPCFPFPPPLPLCLPRGVGRALWETGPPIPPSPSRLLVGLGGRYLQCSVFPSFPRLK